MPEDIDRIAALEAQVAELRALLTPPPGAVLLTVSVSTHGVVACDPDGRSYYLQAHIDLGGVITPIGIPTRPVSRPTGDAQA